MSKFKQSGNTEIKLDHFGAGSVIDGHSYGKWLVIQCDSDSVSLVNLNTFDVVDGLVRVSDVYHLTENEARELVQECLDWAFSDFDYDAVGLKVK